LKWDKKAYGSLDKMNEEAKKMALRNGLQCIEITLPIKSQLLGLMSSLVLKDFGIPSIVIRPITGTFPFFLGSFFFR
jgi:hypothetical protein